MILDLIIGVTVFVAITLFVMVLVKLANTAREDWFE